MAVQTLKKVFRFYVDGFRSMTVGKTLWAIILVKLFIMFAVLKLFFFPDFLISVPSVSSAKQNHKTKKL